MVDKNGNSRMVDSVNSSEAVRHAEGNREALGSRLAMLLFLFLAIQLTINWSANTFFFVERRDQQIYSFFLRALG